MAEVQKDSSLSAEEKQVKKDEILADFALKSERVHTVNQLLKAYTMFDKEIDYIIQDGKVKRRHHVSYHLPESFWLESILSEQGVHHQEGP